MKEHLRISIIPYNQHLIPIALSSGIGQPQRVFGKNENVPDCAKKIGTSASAEDRPPRPNPGIGGKPKPWPFHPWRWCSQIRQRRDVSPPAMAAASQNRPFCNLLVCFVAATPPLSQQTHRRRAAAASFEEMDAAAARRRCSIVRGTESSSSSGGVRGG